MNWIDSNEIRTWAGRRDCQETLPLLVRKLIRATAPSIQAIKFPAGDNVAHGGWDGILEVTNGTEYMPLGKSVWEFGANADAKGKADDDYDKRKKDASVDTTYVCVTPRLWSKGEEWAEEKRKDKIWKEIKVINAEILEEWLEVAPSVAAWLAVHIGKIPPAGVQATEDFWNEWSIGTKVLHPSILLGGRDVEIEELFKLAQTPCIIAIQGTSREEALAFIAASFKNSVGKEEDFFSRSLIIDNVEIFRQVSTLNTPLILIPRFDDTTAMNRAINNGHTVIVPLDPGASDNWINKIILPKLDRDLFVKALVSSGIEKELAEHYSKESTRNITILRRQLKFAGHIPVWAKPENVRDLIPAILVGRWDESFEGDKKIIAKLAGESYELYSQKLTRWLNAPDSPIYKIGTFWRLASPFDALKNAGINITSNDFKLLRSSFLEALSEINPVFDLTPDKRIMAGLFGKQSLFSNGIREGTTQSLILISLFGTQLNFALPTTAEQWVDGAIYELLNSSDPLLWKSLDYKLPLIAEASPTSFLNAVEKQIAAKDSPIVTLFDSDPGFMTSISYHTGLLWALENLAWMPEHLSKSALLLAKLAAVDPGGNLSNRPINSLSEIFKTWHFQTFASYQERMDVLTLISENEKGVAWSLLIRMLPEGQGGTGFPTHRMRWRLSDKILEKSVQWQEIWNTHTYVLNLLLSLFDDTEVKLIDLLNKSAQLSYYDRDTLFAFVKKHLLKIQQTEYSTWHVLRKIVSHHRSYPTAHWVLPPAELSKYDELIELLKPNDELNKYIWLFNEHWPSFPEEHGGKRLSHNEMQEFIEGKRADGLKHIYEKFGIEKIIELGGVVKEGWLMGSALGVILENNEEIYHLCELLKEEPDSRFIWGFIYKKSFLKGISWTLELYDYLIAHGFNNQSLANLFAFAAPSKELWIFIEKTNAEIEKAYWLKANITFYQMGIEEKIHVIKKLTSCNRFVSAINICSIFLEDIPSDLMLELLTKASTETPNEALQMDGYNIQRMFEAFYERGDLKHDDLAKLEWLYMPVLYSSYGDRSPKVLHEELSKRADFFVEVVRWIYKPDNDELFESEKRELTTEQFSNRASRAYELLESWNGVPGVDANGEIDAEYLNKWINDVREIASSHSRMRVADIEIGKMLAQYPEKDINNWPPPEICAIIERINTDELKRNFSSAIFNKRGAYSKSPFSGGEQEREIAAHYNKLAVKHRNTFPNTSGILLELSKSYLRDAKREDDEAEKTNLEH